MTQSQQMMARPIFYHIFHDLINPNEKINNGIELLALIGQDNSDYEVPLIADSCQNGSDLIIFFRITFAKMLKVNSSLRKEPKQF